MARFTAFPNDSEEEKSSPEHSPPRPARPANGRPRRQRYAVPSSSSSSTSGESAEDDAYVGNAMEDAESSMDEEVDIAGDDEEIDAQPTPWAKQLNLEPKRVQNMHSSFFSPESSQALVRVQKKDPLSNLNHRRPADIRLEPKPTRTRASFVQPQAKPPPRKYIRVALTESICAKNESLLTDAGLSMGRSFRVGWGPGNKLAHVGSLVSRGSTSESANSSKVYVTKVKVDKPNEPNILEHLLTHSEIPFNFGDDVKARATPKQTLAFSSLSALYPAQEKSHSITVFRLGHALFDPLDLHLKDDIRDDIRNRIAALRRMDALSTWLARTVSPSVERDVRSATGDDSAQSAFLYLTGNQVERAVEALTRAGNVRLATLISQIPGDEVFRRDLQRQLQIWRDEKADAFMSESNRKLYALASGEVDILDGSSRKETIDMTQGLDWLRVLGLRLWYSAPLGTTLQETFDLYEQLVEASNRRVGAPKPWYLESSSPASDIKDGLYNLIKLSVSESMPLEAVLDPLSFSPSPRDYRLPWFLYVFLARVLRIRDFSDRQEFEDVMDEDGGPSQGYSHLANLVSTNYAAQLQEQNDIQEAAYVLMYLEDDVLRKYTIKEMISQSGPLLEAFNTAGLNGSLRLPEDWVDEGKALYAFYSGDVHAAFNLYIRAKAHQSAHELAVSYLVPGAVLRDELTLLARFFTDLDQRLVEGFATGGQLFIDYVLIVSRVPQLRSTVQSGKGMPDPAEQAELEDLSAKIPRLMQVLPDVLHDKPGDGGQRKAALMHMLSRLLDCVDASVPMRDDIAPVLVEEGARIKNIQASAYGSFMRTIEEMA